MRRAGRPPRLTMEQFEKLVEEALEEVARATTASFRRLFGV